MSEDKYLYLDGQAEVYTINDLYLDWLSGCNDMALEDLISFDDWFDQSITDNVFKKIQSETSLDSEAKDMEQAAESQSKGQSEREVGKDR